jgi:hypothetical protein
VSETSSEETGWEDTPGKRSDVGYKRPPKEHQFKKGQKPPPRRKKDSPAINEVHLFWRVLQEPRRAKINGKPKWVTATELIVRRAFIEAEKGSSTVQRLLNQLLLEHDRASSEDEYEIDLGYPPKD